MELERQRQLEKEAYRKAGRIIGAAIERKIDRGLWGESWRPSNTWNESAENMVKQCIADPEFLQASFEIVMRGLFEAGASAMLEALRKKGHRGFHHNWEDKGRVEDDEGITVFIPDDAARGE